MIKLLENLKKVAGRIGVPEAALRRMYSITYGAFDQKRRAGKVRREFWAIMNKIAHVCETQDVSIWPEFGTLLGLHRDSGPINADPDIDFGAWIEDRAKIRSTMLASGFKLSKLYECTSQGVTILEEAYYVNGIQIDIFYFHRDGERVRTYDFLRDANTSDYSSQKQELSGLIVRQIEFPSFSLVKTTMNNVNVYFPTGTPDHLASRYGSDFMTPDPKWSARDTEDQVVSYDGILKFF